MQSIGLQPAELRHAKRSSYAWGIGFFLFDAAAYALGVYMAVMEPNYAMNLLGCLIAGFSTSGLVIIAHDACHQSLTPNRKLNRIIGTIAFLPALHAYSLWRYGHNFLHHLHTNIRGKDYVWEPLSPAEYQSLSGWKKRKYRFFRSLPGHYFYYLCEIWWKRRFFPRKQFLSKVERIYWFDSFFVVLWIFTLSTILLFLRSRGDWQIYVQSPSVALGVVAHGVALPFLISSMLMSNTEYLHHTHPSIKWFRKRNLDWQQHQVVVSIHVRYIQPVDWFVHWIMDHTAHHLQPSIPLYQLRASQQLIDERIDQVLSYHFSFRKLLEITQRCKLYDDQTGCWKDFNGQSTSEVNIDHQSACTTPETLKASTSS